MAEFGAPKPDFPRPDKASIEGEMTPQREPIRAIERLPIRSFEKAELILVAAGYKVAAEIELTSDTWIKGGAEMQIDEGEIREVLEGIHRYGLVTSLKGKEREEIPLRMDGSSQELLQMREKVGIAAALTQDNLEKYSSILEGKGDRAMGEMYGFPQSSIDAFEQFQRDGISKPLSRFDIPEEYQQREEYWFLNFMVAEHDIEGALQVAKQWAEAIRKASPTIYSEYLEDAKKVVRPEASE